MSRGKTEDAKAPWYCWSGFSIGIASLMSVSNEFLRYSAGVLTTFSPCTRAPGLANARRYVTLLGIQKRRSHGVDTIPFDLLDFSNVSRPVGSPRERGLPPKGLLGHVDYMSPASYSFLQALCFGVLTMLELGALPTYVRGGGGQQQ